MVLDGTAIQLKDVKIPIYNLAAKEDHIAPAKSVFLGSKFFGGEVTYVLADRAILLASSIRGAEGQISVLDRRAGEGRA